VLGAIRSYGRGKSGSLLMLFVLATVSPGCAPAVGGARTSGGSGAGPNTLTGDEIRETSEENLYLAISRLRPRWLQTRARGSLTFGESTGPIVYLFGMQHGPVSTLSTMNVNEVNRVDFLSPIDATTRFGTGHVGGVILVDLARGGGQ